MILKLDLPPEVEESAKRKAAEKGMDLEAFVIEAVKSKSIPEIEQPPPEKITTVEELDALFDEISALHPPATGHVDDSRESIYD